MHQVTIINLLLGPFPINAISLVETIPIDFISHHQLEPFTSALYHITSWNHFPSSLYHITRQNHFHQLFITSLVRTIFHRCYITSSLVGNISHQLYITSVVVTISHKFYSIISSFITLFTVNAYKQYHTTWKRQQFIHLKSTIMLSSISSINQQGLQ